MPVTDHWTNHATNDEQRAYDELELDVLWSKDRVAALRVEQRKIFTRATERMKRARNAK